jgi:hypothetical protein
MRSYSSPLGPRACYDEGKRVAETMMYVPHHNPILCCILLLVLSGQIYLGTFYFVFCHLQFKKSYKTQLLKKKNSLLNFHYFYVSLLGMRMKVKRKLKLELPVFSTPSAPACTPMMAESSAISSSRYVLYGCLCVPMRSV